MCPSYFPKIKLRGHNDYMVQRKKLNDVFYLISGAIGGFIGGFVLLFIVDYLRDSQFFLRRDWLLGGGFVRMDILTLLVWLLISGAFGAMAVYSIILSKNFKATTARNQKLQEVGIAKTEFVFFVVHQLRTPLSALRFSFLMFQNRDLGELNTEQTEIVQTGLKEIDNLLVMIEGLLNIPKIEQRQLPMNKTAMPLDKFLSSVEGSLREFSSLIKQKNISFAYKIPPVKEKMFLEVDWSKIKQVFENLLENALHYTKNNGQVNLNITIEKSSLVVVLSDSGIGVPKLEQGKLFKKFYRATNAKALSSKGTGIGLYLAKFMVEGHGGKIWFTSEEGYGATFYFTLPLKTTVEEFLERI